MSSSTGKGGVVGLGAFSFSPLLKKFVLFKIFQPASDTGKKRWGETILLPPYEMRQFKSTRTCNRHRNKKGGGEFSLIPYLPMKYDSSKYSYQKNKRVGGFHP